MTKPTEFILNSLVRRIECSKVFKDLIAETGAKLNRKGRSRNWLLAADVQQLAMIINAIDNSEQQSWAWIAKILRKNKQPISDFALLQIVLKDRSLTVSQLMQQTDCSIMQARKALDEAEWEQS